MSTVNVVSKGGWPYLLTARPSCTHRRRHLPSAVCVQHGRGGVPAMCGHGQIPRPPAFGLPERCFDDHGIIEAALSVLLQDVVLLGIWLMPQARIFLKQVSAVTSSKESSEVFGMAFVADSQPLIAGEPGDGAFDLPPISGRVGRFCRYRGARCTE